ncbi:MAG: hypothetical protein J5881_00150 [Clostridia bacterium]|nr:hypothetical protein [Clostridia bacterium]
MEERSLRITGTDRNFFGKLSIKLSAMLIPTKVGINSMLISMKRTSVMKAFENSSKEDQNNDSEEQEKKFENSYTAYLEALDKYVLDSIYKKVKNGSATEFEKNALSKYYEVTSLKENEYMEYKYRKQKYLLDLDYESVKTSGKEKLRKRYIGFYINKMDSIYKAILKNYSIKLANSSNVYDSSKEWIYTKIFYTLEDYIQNILSIKIQNDIDNKKDLKEDFERYENYAIGKLDSRDNIEKNKVVLGISRKLFTHSLPLVVAEQCYEKLLKDTRSLVQDTKIATKRERVYTTLINLIEDYNAKLLSTKVYWDEPSKRDAFKAFWDKYKTISKLKDANPKEYKKQKEILFLRRDLKCVENTPIDYSQIIKYYKRKLVDYGAIKEMQNKCKTLSGKFIKARSNEIECLN